MAVDKTVLLMCLFFKGFTSVDVRASTEGGHQTTEPLCTFDFRSRSNETTGKQFGDVFSHEVNMCNWTKVLVLTSGANVQLVSHVVDLFNDRSVSVVHYEVPTETDDSFQATVWHLYHQKQFTNIVWLGRIPEVLMAVLDALFDKECRRFAATMPHDFQIVFVISLDELQKVQKLLEDSFLDNIAVFVTGKEHTVVEEIHTLIWKPHRKRKLESVTHFQPDTALEETACRIFPNSYRGMNGRVLKAVAKEAVAFLHITESQEYSGHVINIINALALYLNFTYVLEPDPKHKSNMTWEYFRTALSQSKVDFGAALTAVNFAHYWNISVTYPVLFANISGVFVQPQKHRLHKLKLFLFDDVHLISTGCIIFVVIMFALIEQFIFRETKRKIIQNQAAQVLPVEKCHRESGDKLLPRESSTSSTELFFGLLGVMLNQDTLPIPKHVSLRILIYSWRLIAFVLSTTLTSTITARLIKSFDNPEISSMSEIIARENYILGADADSINSLLMVDFGQDATALQAFLSRSVLFQGSARALFSTKEVISELETGKYVAFLFSPIVEMRYKKQLKNLIPIPESVMAANLGIPLPENSTLQKVFSDAIIKLTDCGFFLDTEMMFTWQLDASSDNHIGDNKVNLPMDVHFFFENVFVCYYFLGVSAATFVGEFVFIKIKILFGKFTREGNN